MDIGKRLRDLRTRAGLSQNKLSKMANVAQSIISLTEKGEREPSIGVLSKLCGAMGLSLLDFFMEEQELRINPALQRLTGLCASLSVEEIEALCTVASALTNAHKQDAE